MYILVTKAKALKWYWKIVADNGQILATSETYVSKWNARRAANKLSVVNGYEVRVA